MKEQRSGLRPRSQKQERDTFSFKVSTAQFAVKKKILDPSF